MKRGFHFTEFDAELMEVTTLDSSILDVKELQLEIDPRLDEVKETQLFKDEESREVAHERKRQMKVPSKSIQIMKSMLEQQRDFDLLEFEQKEEERQDANDSNKRKKSI